MLQAARPVVLPTSVQKTPEISSAPANGNQATQHTPTIFEKLFGKPFQLMLAYAGFDRRKFGPRLWVMTHTRVARGPGGRAKPHIGSL
jgi:hypothetical protein